MANGYLDSDTKPNQDIFLREQHLLKFCLTYNREKPSDECSVGAIVFFGLWPICNSWVIKDYVVVVNNSIGVYVTCSDTQQVCFVYLQRILSRNCDEEALEQLNFLEFLVYISKYIELLYVYSGWIGEDKLNWFTQSIQLWLVFFN